jgi:hypothetical protein
MEMQMDAVRNALLMTICLATTATCVTALASAGADIVSDVAPPPPHSELAPSPRDGYVWSPGHWELNRHSYVWVSGTWITERRGARWIPDHWDQVGAQWHYVPGHWQR